MAISNAPNPQAVMPNAVSICANARRWVTRPLGAAAGLGGAGQARIQRGQITVAPRGELFVGEVAVDTHALMVGGVLRTIHANGSQNSFVAF